MCNTTIVTRINIPLEDEIHKKLRIKALQEGQTIKDIVEKALEEYL